MTRNHGARLRPARLHLDRARVIALLAVASSAALIATCSSNAKPGCLMSAINTTVVKGTTFTALVMNDEFGPSYKPDVSRDNEVAASYIAKTIHLLGSDTTAAPPRRTATGRCPTSTRRSTPGRRPPTGRATSACCSRRSEDPGVVRRRQAGLQRLSPVAHDGDQQLAVTGGTTADGVNAAATKSTDGSALQVLVYNHVAGGAADVDPIERRFAHPQQPPVHGADSHSPVHRRLQPRQLVPGLAGDGLAVEPDPTAVGHAAGLRGALLLRTTAQPVAGSATFQFAQSIYGVDLFQISSAASTSDAGATSDAGSLGPRG